MVEEPQFRDLLIQQFLTAAQQLEDLAKQRDLVGIALLVDGGGIGHQRIEAVEDAAAVAVQLVEGTGPRQHFERPLADPFQIDPAGEIEEGGKDLIAARLSDADRCFAFGDGALALLTFADDEAVFETFAETLRKDVAAQIFKTDSFETHATVSIAAYPIGDKSPDATEILNDTAAQVRALTRDGGNRVTVMGETAEAAQEQRDIARRADNVKRAMEQDRLKLAYQSIASLDGSNLQIYDVFVRMVDEGGRELMARDFLPAAEKAGLMRLIDRWVINKALRYLARHKGPEKPPTFFLRLSEDTVRDADGFIRWTLEQVRKLPEVNDYIVFEIQEAIIEKHVRKATLLAKALDEAGIGMALDYFGVSPTCENLLDELPTRYVKFHYSYTECFSEAETGKRFRELMEAAKQRGLKTIVSQVEQASDMAVLWQLGVNYIQGNSVQEPEVVMLQADVSLG